jgi:hypothetical protein
MSINMAPKALQNRIAKSIMKQVKKSQGTAGMTATKKKTGRKKKKGRGGKKMTYDQYMKVQTSISKPTQ